MSDARVKHARLGLAAALLCALLSLPGLAQAQVVVVANGSPITELDIQQRTKLVAQSTHKTPTRQEAIEDLINDRLKLSRAKSYGFELPDKDVEEAYRNIATRQHISVQQFDQLLQKAGIQPSALKARLRADLTWNQLVRGKFSASLQVNESDIANAMVGGGQPQEVEGYIYKLYPIIVLTPEGLTQASLQSKAQIVESLRSRFTSCTHGLPLARSMRDVAVRDPVTRSSGDLPDSLRELLGKMEVGHLTLPEATPQGLQMFALCDKKASKSDSPAKAEARAQIFNRKFEAESKRFLDEIRKQAMIEYKK